MNGRDLLESWWGEYELATGETAEWDIGPLRVWLHRGPSEWRLAREWLDKNETRGSNLVRNSAFPEGHIGSERFAFSEVGPEVRLRPLSADRAVVARPKTPFRVLPGHGSRVFMELASVGRDRSRSWPHSSVRAPDRTPVGYLVRCDHPSRRALLCPEDKCPDQPGGDASGGRPTLDPGCDREPSARRSRRRAAELPGPLPFIYSGGTGEAWSEEVHMVRTEDGDTAELEVRAGPPEEAMGAKRLSAPRQIAEKGHLFRAFGSLLGFD